MFARYLAMAAGLGAAAIWGGMYVVSKVILQVVPPFTLLTLRLLLGSAVIGLLFILSGKLGRTRSGRRRLIMVGLLGYGVSLGLQFVGTSLSTAANAAVVTSASPAFMVLFGSLILNEALNIRRIASLLLATLGVLIVVDLGSLRLESQFVLGNISLLAAALTWGLFSVLTRKVSFDHDILTISFLGFLGGLIVGVPLAGVEANNFSLISMTPSILAGILYLGIVSTALAMLLWNHALAVLEAGIVSILFFAQPIVGAGLGYLLLGEQLSLAFWIGAALIAAGLFLAAFPGNIAQNQVDETTVQHPR